MDRKLYLSIFAAFITAAAIVLMVMLAAPVLKPLAWALIIGVATMPHYNRVLRRYPEHPDRSAGIMVFIVAICFVLPVAALVVTAAVNAPEWYKQVVQLVQSVAKTGTTSFGHWPVVQKVMSLVERFNIDLAGLGGKVASTSSTVILGMAADLARNMFSFLGTLAVALFILYFIYRDGERAVCAFIGRLAPDPRKAQHYASQVRSITTAVTVGTVLTCATQGVLAGLGYWVAGVPAPIFCGGLTAIAALIPVVGTGVVWVPLVAILALNGSYLAAGLLAAWCIIFVGIADNAIRPLAIGASSDISTLAVVLGALCGVVSMGLLGLIVGPVIFAVLFSLWDDAVADADEAEQGEVT
ncbi:AI-2E family transporter [Geomonas subterranea]|uniref:AI-2E family transporter n=1 Tax=Geomonas subterranea TaxID=2847989 RepID=UPI001C482395|nr:AI-2E family transporter [Geomonas subterranea]QXM09974.1 AI-2E family transporter [Geomonas subterranea]